MYLTRREILSAFLGAQIAIAACRQNSAPKFPAGEIVGANVSLGHILRENRSFEVLADNWETVKVAVIGAGIAGLSAGWKFGRKDFDDFVILELEKDVGGTSQSSSGNPVSYPWGAHYLPVPFQENIELISLLDEMSLIEGRGNNGEVIIKEQFLCREPEERVFYKGRWYDGLYLSVGANDEDKSQYLEFQKHVNFWVKWRDANGRRAFVVPLANCSTDAETTDLDKITFAEWLRQKGFTSERLLWYCDYACRDDYGLKLDQASAWAGLFYFCSRVRKSGEESQAFITFPEGNGRFVNHLAEKVKSNIRKSHTVVSVIPNDEGVDVVCLNGSEIKGFHCEKVIFASPMFTAPYVVRGFNEAPPFAANDFQHTAWFVANLFLKDRPKPRFVKDFPLAWDNVLYESPSLGYVNATHQKGIDYGPAIWTYYYPMCAEDNGRTKLFNYEWKDLADVCLTDIARAHPEIYELCERIDIMRWGHAMISPRPNFIRSGVREKAMQPYRNIHFAHTDLSGIALFEEAFYHGLRAAGQVMRQKHG
ncbi:MAG: FAD-dependent oxidoreductase, partial [Saprospiraceae bacterium]|nr:FAD-dependent oxidoreductase [Pyrinomonadaceae bacterium]